MKMQLRKNRKKKIMGDEDLGYEEKPPKPHKKSKSKMNQEKAHSNEEFSDISKDHKEVKHSLRIQPQNEGIYKKMNEGKYLYTNPATKKASNSKKVKKPQLKYINNETISHFKKLIYRLHKKEEEALLNKKKKREEIKQKNKTTNLNVSNQLKLFPQMYIPQMQINNQNPTFYNEYQNYYYLNPPQSYQYNHQMISPFIPQNCIIGPENFEDRLNIIYSRGIVNQVIGAIFIKECQERQKKEEKNKISNSKGDSNKEGDNKNNINEKNDKEGNEKEKENNSLQENDNELKKPNII